jgi:diketogulonate reductase-like aldo/keto reductase
MKMNNGAEIPVIGFGLWRNKDKQECLDSIKFALDAGYRHFDDAQAYGNEQYLGEAIKASNLKRQDLFITTKVAVQNFGYHHALKSFKGSLEKLQMEYVDLLLLHFPVSLLRGKSWNALEEIHDAGHAKSIGVSNYTIRHLEELLKKCRVKPVVNQIELSAALQQPELVQYCKDQDIIVEAYTPLAEGKMFNDAVLKAIAEKHHKSVPQIMLRWCVDYGTVPLTKSVHQDRIKDNIDLFDFKLDADDMAKIKSLDQNLRNNWDPTQVP